MLTSAAITVTHKLKLKSKSKLQFFQIILIILFNSLKDLTFKYYFVNQGSWDLLYVMSPWRNKGMKEGWKSQPVRSYCRLQVQTWVGCTNLGLGGVVLLDDGPVLPVQAVTHPELLHVDVPVAVFPSLDHHAAHHLVLAQIHLRRENTSRTKWSASCWQKSIRGLTDRTVITHPQFCVQPTCSHSFLKGCLVCCPVQPDLPVNKRAFSATQPRSAYDEALIWASEIWPDTIPSIPEHG